MAQYAEITSLVVSPANPQSGSRVDVILRVKNKYTGPMSIIGQYEPVGVTGYYSSPDRGTVPAGGELIVTGYFTMPSRDVDVIGRSWWYGSDSKWHLDDEKTITVALQPSVSYRIVLEYGDAYVPVPAPGVPLGQKAKVHVYAQYTGSATKQLGVSWVVKRPDGTTLQTYSDTDTWPYTSPGSDHDFYGGSFTLNIAGGYTIDLYLTLGGQPAGEFHGSLCTVTGEPPPITTGLRSVSVNVTDDTYDYGATVPYVLGFDYKGEAQSGTLRVEVGTYPFFTPVAVVTSVDYDFTKKTEYTRVTENRSFILPSTLVRGQTYSVRATLTTADGVSDKDTDYSALKVLDITSTELKDLVLTPTYRDYALGEVYPFSISFRYKGIAQGGTIQAIIGKGVTYKPVYTYTPTAIQYEQAATLTTISKDLSITLPKTLEPGVVYSLKVILTTLDGEKDDDTRGTAFKIGSGEIPEDPGVGEYRKVKDYTYPYAATYRGDASEATAEFTVAVAQLPGTDWISQQVVNSFEGSVTEYGSHMLQLVIYERDEGLLSKGYKIIAVATPPKEVAGQECTPQGIVNLVYVNPQFGPATWALVIIAALALVAIIVSMLQPTVRKVVWGEGGVIDTITDIGKLLSEVVPMMMIMMMLMLMSEQTRELYEPPGTPPRPKPVTEATVKAAKWSWEKAKGLVRIAKRELTDALKALEERRAEERRAETEERRAAARERVADAEERVARAEERVAEAERREAEA